MLSGLDTGFDAARCKFPGFWQKFAVESTYIVERALNQERFANIWYIFHAFARHKRVKTLSTEKKCHDAAISLHAGFYRVTINRPSCDRGLDGRATSPSSQFRSASTETRAALYRLIFRKRNKGRERKREIPGAVLSGRVFKVFLIAGSLKFSQAGP